MNVTGERFLIKKNNSFLDIDGDDGLAEDNDDNNKLFSPPPHFTKQSSNDSCPLYSSSKIFLFFCQNI